MSVSTPLAISDAAKAYDEVIRIDAHTVVGKLFGVWGSVEVFRGAAPTCRGGAVRAVLVDRLTVEAAVAIVAGSESARLHVVAESGVDPAAVGIIESRRGAVTVVGEPDSSVMVTADSVERAIEYAHLLQTYSTGKYDAPACDVPAVVRHPLDLVRALSGDDVVPFFRGAAMAPALGVARLGGRGVAFLGHHRMLGVDLMVDDLPRLARHLRFAQARGLPTVWIAPVALSKQATGEAVAPFLERLAKASTEIPVAVLLEEGETVPWHLQVTSPSLVSIPIASVSRDVARWIDFTDAVAGGIRH